MGAKGEIARGFGHIQTNTAFEPLALVVYQANQCNRHLADHRGQLGKVIKALLPTGVENIERMQMGEAG